MNNEVDILNAINRDVKREHDVDVSTVVIKATLIKYYNEVAKCLKCKESVDLAKLGRFQFNSDGYLIYKYKELMENKLTPDEIDYNIKHNTHITYLRKHHLNIFREYYG